MSDKTVREPLDPATLHEAGSSLAASLPPLLVEAERLATSIVPGIHGRRRSGPGENFWQYRHYDHSDSAADIDWRQSARSDHVYVRENEWEAAQSILFWRDASPSMGFASEYAPCSKAHRAAVLNLALASLLVRAGERIGPLEGVFRPSTGTTGLRRLADHMSLEGAPSDTPIPMADYLPRSARIVIASDFFMDLDHLATRLRRYSGTGMRGHLIQVLDPAEVDLPYSGRVIFEDQETAQDYQTGRAENLREDYAARLHAHRNTLNEMARAWGWTLTLHRTDEAAHKPLLELYQLMAEARA